MKICPFCGNANKDKNNFCVRCGSKFPVEPPVPPAAPSAPPSMEVPFGYAEQQKDVVEFTDPEKTELLRDDYTDSIAFENEETMILDDQQDIAAFENEETVILDDHQGAENDNAAPAADDAYAFENEETVILDDQQDMAAFENEETVVIDDRQGSDNETTGVIRSGAEEPPAAPNFGYEGEVPVYRDPQNDVESDTAYIDHLRRLKGLLDDGIINEWEFEQKKQQILGLHAEKEQQK